MTNARGTDGSHHAGLTLLQPAFLGDVVLATSLLESWHRHFPEHRPEVLVRRGAEGLFEDHPFVGRVHVWDRRGGRKYLRLLRLARQMRDGKERLVVNLHRHPSMAMLTRYIANGETVGFSAPTARHAAGVRLAPHDFGDGRHETERNHGLIEPWLGPWNPESDRPRLHPADRHVRAASEWPTGALVLAPASVWATKRWPSGHWSALADAWTERNPGKEVILLGGPADGELLGTVKQGCRVAAPRACAGGLDLLGSAALMCQSAAVVSNDSAPLHMAGAVDVPVVGVFCSTTPRFGFGVLPAMRGGDRAADVEVGEASLGCKPCGPHGHARCPEGHFKCGTALEVRTVLNALVKVSSLPSGSRIPSGS